MKSLQTIANLVALVLVFGYCQSLEAQQDTTQLKFSEEVVGEPENKNVRWVKLRPRQYNMDNVSSLFKIATSPLHNIVRQQVFLAGYEKKIPGTQWSLELKLSTNLNGHTNFRYEWPGSSTNRNLQSVSEIKEYAAMHFGVRYYILKNRNITMGKSGDNPWGFYGTAKLISGAIWSKELETLYDTALGFNAPIRITERKGLSSRSGYVGLGVGYQQCFLKRGFFDISGGYAKRLVEERYNSFEIFLDFTIGYSIFKVK